jgi:hypothetical protein
MFRCRCEPGKGRSPEGPDIAPETDPVCQIPLLERETCPYPDCIVQVGAGLTGYARI